METDEQVRIALMCKEMNWTYDEYLDQPEWLIDILTLVEAESAEEQKRQNRRSKK